MSQIRADLCKELRQYLEEFTALDSNANATQRDYTRIQAKIDLICQVLDRLDEKSRV